MRDPKTSIRSKSGDPIHLAYENAFNAELRQKGRNNPELRRNYFLEDTIEEGNFISRERLLTCARSGITKNGILIPLDPLYVGIDWARRSDHTWLAVANAKNDIVEWFKYPHAPYGEQVEMIKADMGRKHLAVREKDGKAEEYEWTYLERVVAVLGDSTGGTGDAPMEMLRKKSGLPVGDESFYQFTLQSKNELYLNFEAALFKDAGDPMKCSYPADHPLTAEFEDQMTKLEREYKQEGEYLSVHHPKTPEGRDDAPDASALALLSAVKGFVGEMLVL